jgi:hypothetical protein
LIFTNKVKKGVMLAVTELQHPDAVLPVCKQHPTEQYRMLAVPDAACSAGYAACCCCMQQQQQQQQQKQQQKQSREKNIYDVPKKRKGGMQSMKSKQLPKLEEKKK